MAVRSDTSRTPASITSPAQPRALKDEASSSPNMPSVDSAVVVGAREAAAVARPKRLLILVAEVRRSPRVSSRLERLRGPPGRCVGLGEPRPAVSGFRLLACEEGDDRRCVFARPHRLFRPVAHAFGVGPVRVGDDERRVIGKAVAAALAKAPPLIERVSDARRIGRSSRVARRRGVLRRTRRRDGQ